MATLLTKVQEFCQEIIEKFYSVYSLNIEIIDNELRYIAAVGRYSDRINELIPSIGGRLTIKVLSSKKSIYVKDPENHSICSECYNLANCKDRVEICYPIVFNDVALGVISIASTSFDQTEMIKENYETVILSVSLLAGTIQEHAGNYHHKNELNMCSKINSFCLNAIPDGAMILKNNSQVIQMNTRCENTLGYSIAQIPYLEKINQIKISFKRIQEEYQECHIKIRGKEFILTGKLCILNGHNDTSISLFSFGNINISKDLKYSLVEPETYTFDSFIGKNSVFLNVIEESKKQAFFSNCFLIWGEAGVGKERLARTIHNESPKRNNKFIKISRNNDFTEIYKTLGSASLETSDVQDEYCNNIIKGSTIYFDEVGALNHYNQEKLLSLLSSTNYLDYKIICSSTCDLKKLVRNGDFIKDLYYALELNSVYLPPLRNRNEDIVLLAEYYLKKYNLFHKKNLYLSKKTIDHFLKYSWYGNIIELENTISYIVQAHDDVEDEITEDNIPTNLKNNLMENNKKSFNLEALEKEVIINALNEFDKVGKSKKLVADKLGISLSTLYRKLKYYNISHNSNYD